MITLASVHQAVRLYMVAHSRVPLKPGQSNPATTCCVVVLLAPLMKTSINGQRRGERDALIFIDLEWCMATRPSRDSKSSARVIYATRSVNYSFDMTQSKEQWAHGPNSASAKPGGSLSELQAFHASAFSRRRAAPVVGITPREWLSLQSFILINGQSTSP